MEFACFGMSISAISYTISKEKISYERARLWQQQVFQNYSQTFDICTWLDLKFDDEHFGSGVFSQCGITSVLKVG